MKKQSVVRWILFIGIIIAGILAAGIAVVEHKRNQWKDVFYSCPYVRIHVNKENENTVITNKRDIQEFRRDMLKGIIITNRKDILSLCRKLNPDFIDNSTRTTMSERSVAWVGYPYLYKRNEDMEEGLLIINIYSNGLISQVTSIARLAVTRNPEYCSEVFRLIAKYQESAEPIIIKEANPPGSPLRSSGSSSEAVGSLKN